VKIDRFIMSTGLPTSPTTPGHAWPALGSEPKFCLASLRALTAGFGTVRELIEQSLNAAEQLGLPSVGPNPLPERAAS